MANKTKVADVDSILAAAGSKMHVKAPPTGNAAADLGHVTTASQSIETEAMRVTGPVDFEMMRRQAEASKKAPITPQITAAPQASDDARFGKAYKIAVNTYKVFKVDTVGNFVTLIEEIKNNL